MEDRYFLGVPLETDKDVRIKNSNITDARQKKIDEKNKLVYDHACSDYFLRGYPTSTLEERIIMLNRRYKGAELTQ